MSGQSIYISQVSACPGLVSISSHLLASHLDDGSLGPRDIT